MMRMRMRMRMRLAKVLDENALSYGGFFICWSPPTSVWHYCYFYLLYYIIYFYQF